MQVSSGYSAVASDRRPQSYVGKLLSEVEPERVEWLWPGRLPLGKLSVLDGDPGLGKSAVTLDLAARVSAGLELPDGGRCDPAGVVLLSAEDGLADTIRPRLDAAGADTERIVALSTVTEGGTKGGERTISIPRDLDTVERAIARVDAALLIVDPLMAFLAERTDSHKDQHVRRALAPLAVLVERTRTAAVIVRHLTKAEGGNPLYRGGGSIGIIGAARSGLVVGMDPDHPERRILAANKHNLSRAARSLVFRVGSASNGSARVYWLGESNLNAADILKEPTDPHKKSAVQEAKEFLRETLKDGPVASEKVHDDAKAAGISPSALKRAKLEMGVTSKKQSDGTWAFVPPDDLVSNEGSGERDGEVQGDHTTAVEPLEPLGPLGRIAHQVGENPAYLTEEGQGGQEVQGDRDNQTVQVAQCKHGYPNGKGCYLCDPDHPYRVRGASAE